LTLFILNGPALKAMQAVYSVTPLEIRTADNILIKGRWYSNDNLRVMIYCHRLLGSQRGDEVMQLVDTFINDYDLITFNFRGHKTSGRATSVGGNEVLDLRAVISFAVEKGYKKTVVVGTGMGGCAAIRAAGLFRNIDALAVVSPSGFSPDRQPFLVRFALDVTLNTDLGKVPVQFLTNTRVGDTYAAGFPIDMVAQVSPIPFLVVQSEHDRHVALKTVQEAFSRAREPKELVVIPGGKHADRLLQEKSTVDQIGQWLQQVLGKEDQAGSGSRDQAGPLTLVLSGDVPLPQEVLVREGIRRLQAGNGPADNASVEKAVKEALAFHGYTVCSLEVTGSAPDFMVDIAIPRIGAVTMSGNKWISEDFIRHLLLIDGDYYNAFELDQAIRRVSAEPAVHKVVALTREDSDSKVELSLKVVEQNPYRVVLATQYTDIDNFYGVGLTWNEYNPTGLQMDLRGLVGMFSRDLLGSFKIGKSIWGRNLRVEGACFNTIKSWDDPDFINTRQEVQETGGEAAVEYQLASTARVRLGGFGKKYTTPSLTNGFVVEEGTAAGQFVRLDIRGKLPLQDFPRFKWRNTFYYLGTGPGGLGDFNFHTYQGTVRGEFTLWHYHRSVTTIRYGQQQGAVPPQEQFSLGGVQSLPGYNSDLFVNTRLFKARQEFCLYARHWRDETSWFSPYRLVLFINAGTVWGEGYTPATKDLKYDAGFEINYKKVMRLGVARSLGPHKEKWPHIYLGWDTRILQPLQKLIQ